MEQRGLVMGAEGFSIYLKKKLSEYIEDYTNVLCSGLSGDINSIYRNTGRREMLVALVNDIDYLLKTFEEGNK